MSWQALTGSLLLLALLGITGSAAVTRFEIISREPLADGMEFGDVGPYERIIGRVYYTLDPELPQNRNVVDLKHAPRNTAGLVELSADLFILAPVDLSKGNGAILYDVNNRGRVLAVRFFNDAPGGNNPRTARDIGNGYLMRHGFTLVSSGWDAEVLPGDDRKRLLAPAATQDGTPITGTVRYELSVNEPSMRTNMYWPEHGAYRPTQRGLREATLTWRLRPGDPRVPIPREQFTLHVTEIDPKRPGQLPQIDLEIPAGIQPGYLYELIYEAQGPIVHGTAFTAVRDLVSAIKHGKGRDNPLAPGGKPAIRFAYGFGVSQSGRFLREMTYSDFNQDEQGRQVFDGIIPHVAGGGLGSFNHRFAQPAYFSSQHDRHEMIADRFPFSYEDQTNPYTRQIDGILRRSLASGTAPKVMHTQSAAEYWTRSGSLPHTDPLGSRDAAVPDGVRFYSFGGTQHGPSGFPPPAGIGQTVENPGNYTPMLRALLLALDRWCREGKEPPPSVYPHIADGTLVESKQTATGFPAIPGIRVPEVIQQPSLLNFGPRWEDERIMDHQPPQAGPAYKTLVPRSDATGNDVGCLLPPEVAVPLATFTGWNLRSPASGAANELVALKGSYILLPRDEQLRRTTGDPRPSLEQLYGDVDAYMKKLEAKCRQMAAAGYLLEEDIADILNRVRPQAEGALKKADP